jgi:predicted porin
MNKKLLTVAITAGLMVPGLAAADVKIFGAVQAETGNVDVDATGAPSRSVQLAGRNAGGDSGAIHGGGKNALGFKGSEKLGNGLTAYFKVNSQFSTFNSNQTAWGGRDAFVGLKGDGWHVQFGTMNNRYKSASVSYDPLVATGLQARAQGGMSGLHNGYNDNVGEVGFKSGGFSGGIQLTLEDSSNDTDAAALGWAGDEPDSAGDWNGNIKYAANNFEVGLAYADSDFGTKSGDADAWKIHGKWSGNGFSVMAQYENLSVDTTAAAGGTSLGTGAYSIGTGGAGWGNSEDTDIFMIAATYKISDATTLIGRYYDTSSDDIRGVQGANGDADGWAIAVNHNLSKRTSVYGGFMANDYDTNAASTYVDTDVDAWAIGMLHKF